MQKLCQWTFKPAINLICLINAFSLSKTLEAGRGQTSAALAKVESVAWQQTEPLGHVTCFGGGMFIRSHFGSRFNPMRLKKIRQSVDAVAMSRRMNNGGNCLQVRSGSIPRCRRLTERAFQSL